MRLVFMGTPDFSVPALKALAGSHEVVAVVTQPDKPKGRGNGAAASPVKLAAISLGIPVYQPIRVREEAFIRQMRELKPEVCVVAAFGQILPKELLDLPSYGCVNIHASLLPRYRGASPIQWSVINGDMESGVTTMLMDVGMDTGDILEQASLALAPKETGGSLFGRLALLGGELILSTLGKMEAGTLIPVPQEDAQATYVAKIQKSFGEIEWSEDAARIERLVRGLNPWPSAYTFCQGKMLKIWDADVLPSLLRADGNPSHSHLPSPNGQETFSGGGTGSSCGFLPSSTGLETLPGTVLRASGDSLQIQTGDGILQVSSLQLEGKKRMDTAAFLRGFELHEGLRLGRA